MELPSPPPCPTTVTISRNPPRRARPTPKSVVPLREPLSSTSLSRKIFSGEVPENPKGAGISNAEPAARTLAEALKVYLRIRPLTVQKTRKDATAKHKKAWPKNPKSKGNNCKPKTKSSGSCEDLRSVTVAGDEEDNSEVYERFSHVFSSQASQGDVYKQWWSPQ